MDRSGRRGGRGRELGCRRSYGLGAEDLGRGEVRGESGFTMLELLIVVVVLGILAATVIFALSGVTSQSAVSTCRTDAATVENAVGDYNVQTGGTPTVTAAILTNPSAPYLHNFPTNPNYTISISGGVVLIAAPPGVTPVAYGTTNACANA